MNAPVLVTGGAGFIGCNFVLQWLAHERASVINLDSLTYAGNPHNLSSVAHDSRYTFLRGDIGDHELVADLLRLHQPGAIVHFAAESHVDRSIHAPEEFVRTNVLGTFQLLMPRARLDLPSRRRAPCIPFSPRVDGQGVRIAQPERSRVFRNHGLCAQ